MKGVLQVPETRAAPFPGLVLFLADLTSILLPSTDHFSSIPHCIFPQHSHHHNRRRPPGSRRHAPLTLLRVYAFGVVVSPLRGPSSQDQIAWDAQVRAFRVRFGDNFDYRCMC